eukprot:6188442-Pleurochrysis_carterae.AAC.5
MISRYVELPARRGRRRRFAGVVSSSFGVARLSKPSRGVNAAKIKRRPSRQAAESKTSNAKNKI